MELATATAQLSALAHEGRLAVFRMLVRAGREGLPAGDIASRLGMPPNTLSAQLSILLTAGLAGKTRRGRSVVYAVRFEAVSRLLVYLMEDCCEGRPEVCGPVASAVQSLAFEGGDAS